jgi:diaminopimelate decarboxylase
MKIDKIMKKISGNPYINKENENIFIDQIPLQYYTGNFKTPMLIFLENRIRDNIQSFLEIFSSEFEDLQCYYSFKANFLPEICDIARSEEIGAEIIGIPELKLALDIGFSPRKILVGGPYLPKKLIKMSILNNVKEIIVYNLEDLKKINDIAKENDKIQDICIRVKSQKYDSRLGVELNVQNLDFLENHKDKFHCLKITTVLSHYSTQMNNIELFKKNINSVAENLNKLKNIGVNIENLNLGGGFPEAAIMTDQQLKRVASEIKKTLDDLKLNYKSIYFEPGRYFVGDAGVFLAKIVQLKENRWVVLNIGNHICPKFARCSLRFYNVSKIADPHKYKTSISGIIPTDQDVLAKDYFFTEQNNKGDKVLVTNVGAYCLTFSNRFPYTLPRMLLVKDNECKQIFDPLINKDFSLT